MNSAINDETLAVLLITSLLVGCLSVGTLLAYSVRTSPHRRSQMRQGRHRRDERPIRHAVAPSTRNGRRWSSANRRPTEADVCAFEDAAATARRRAW